MVPPHRELIDTLRAFILDELLGQQLALADDTPLIEKGYLTSLQTVELVAFIAERFGVELEPEHIDETNFRSLESIASLISKKGA